MENEFIRESGAGRIIVLNEHKTPKEPTVQEQRTESIVAQPPF